jgi:hypothetical protein
MRILNFLICRKQVFPQKMPNSILLDVVGNIFRSPIPEQTFPVSVH